MITGAELESYAEQEIVIPDVGIMNIQTAARWLNLIESVEQIYSSCEKRTCNEENTDILFEERINNLTQKIKPHKAVSKYINERLPATIYDLVTEIKNGED